MARDSVGNVAVDYVWGNFPIQPNDDRDTPLDPELDNHNIVSLGWSGYPGFVNNNPGSWDDLTVPNVVGLTEAAATTAINGAGLTKGTVTTSADGATEENDGKVKSQTPTAGTVFNPSGGYNPVPNVALVLFAYVDNG
jgi:hypothetical protein